MIAELPEAWQRVLQSIRSAEDAWRTPDSIAAGLGWEAEPTWDLLASMDVAGWLAVWERPDGPVVTLSPLGAERLGVRLREHGSPVRLTWVPVDEPEPRGPRLPRSDSFAPGTGWQEAVDLGPPPDAGLNAPEPVRRPAGPRRPALLMGLRLSPWPGPRVHPGDSCPACGCLPLPPHGYCLLCDRWGLDAAPERPERPAPSAQAVSRQRARELERFLAARRRRKSRRTHQPSPR
jgi:hypothetical protein